MALPAPIILLPTGGADYTTDAKAQTLSGTTSAETAQIEVNGSTLGVYYTPGEDIWAWTGDLVLGSNTISVVAVEKNTGVKSAATTIQITLIDQDDFITVSPPTGIRLRRYQDKIEIITSKNTELQVVGYNFYVSTQSSGVNNAYAKINETLVATEAFYEDSKKEIGRTVNAVGNIQVTTITEEIIRSYYYSQMFDEEAFNRLVNNGSLPPVVFGSETSFYFVVTAVIYDSISGQVTESVYSAELEGSPITITTGLVKLPARTQSDIILTYSRELLAADSGIDTKPGTVLRDIVDPISEEQARVYVIQDFMHRSLSVSALLEFDDADGDGVSDPVSSSTPKRALKVALGLVNDYDVQNLIDSQFDGLASNVDRQRQGATSAVGKVVFYTDVAPIRDMYVQEGAQVSTLGDLDDGIPSQTYRVLAGRSLDYESRDAFYNSVLQRYELEVDVEAINTGEATNTDSYTVKTISTGADSDFRVENPNPISFGVDRQSNDDLATDIMLAYFADTGTEGGYAKTALGIPGVRKVRVEKAGDELMRRDWDDVRSKHVGGKVDIYVEGSRSQQVYDKIAFSFESIQASGGGQQGEIFSVINAAAFQFRTNNPYVTAHTPIFDVTKVHNATRSKDYDLAGFQIIGDGDTIDLDEKNPLNASIGLATSDIIRVDYKFRSSDVFILSHQPVEEIISVVGEISGELTQANWELVKLQDPLEEGESTIANDGVRIKYANNLPLTEFQTIEDEEHAVIVGIPEELNYLGADPESIKITNTDKTVTYIENYDYTVNSGTSSTKTSINIVESGAIINGQRVLISYVAIENFTITYTTNSLLDTVQDKVLSLQHACADVIVKHAIENKVDMIMTVIPKAGVTNLTQLTSHIQTAVSNYVSQLGIGRSLTQSEVVEVIKAVPDVDYVVIPFIRMVKADESLIVRDDLGSPQFQIYSEGLSTAYITANSVLSYKTTDKGGPTTLFRGIFEDNMPLVLQSDPLEVADGPGRGYIQSDGRIIVSSKDGSLPDTKKYQAAYWSYGETGSKDINVASVEYLRLGSFSITFDTPREVNKQSF